MTESQDPLHPSESRQQDEVEPTIRQGELWGRGCQSNEELGCSRLWKKYTPKERVITNMRSLSCLLFSSCILCIFCVPFFFFLASTEVNIYYFPYGRSWYAVKMEGRKEKTSGGRKNYDVREALHTIYEGMLVQKKAKKGTSITWGSGESCRNLSMRRAV